MFVELQASLGTHNEDHYQDILKFNYFPGSLFKTISPNFVNLKPSLIFQSLCWEYFPKIFRLCYLFHLLFQRKTFLTFKWRQTEMEHILLNSHSASNIPHFQTWIFPWNSCRWVLVFYIPRFLPFQEWQSPDQPRKYAFWNGTDLE